MRRAAQYARKTTTRSKRTIEYLEIAEKNVHELVEVACPATVDDSLAALVPAGKANVWLIFFPWESIRAKNYLNYLDAVTLELDNEGLLYRLDRHDETVIISKTH